MAPILRFEYSSDRSLLVRFDDAVTAQARARVARFTRMLGRARPPEVMNVHPAYNSVLVVFDALAADHDRMKDVLSALAERMGAADLPEPKRVEIPVRYGGSGGPDLEDVAALHRLTPAQVIELHTGTEYEVAFLGFSPGFAYLAGLPEAIATPRLDRPRARVAPGSVGIAGGQTGVYPSATPGGWRLIGRTELQLFDPRREPPCLLAPGDHVRFVPVSR